MNPTQIVITALYGTSAIIAVLVSVFVIRSTGERRRRRPGADVETVIERENRYAVAIVVALVVLLVATIFAVPYGDTSTEGAQVVQVEAFQFGWKVEPNTIKAGEPVAFVLHSRDTQHGFGIYDDTKLLAQAQVPGNEPGSDQATGAEQRLVHTFDEPGTYEINCLEYCGVGHHLMTGTFEVTG